MERPLTGAKFCEVRGTPPAFWLWSAAWLEKQSYMLLTVKLYPLVLSKWWVNPIQLVGGYCVLADRLGLEASMFRTEGLP
jgi:hypothetical protein